MMFQLQSCAVLRLPGYCGKKRVRGVHKDHCDVLEHDI